MPPYRVQHARIGESVGIFGQDRLEDGQVALSKAGVQDHKRLQSDEEVSPELLPAMPLILRQGFAVAMSYQPRDAKAARAVPGDALQPVEHVTVGGFGVAIESPK